MKSFYLKVPIYDVIVKVTVGDKSFGESGQVSVVSDGCYWIKFRDSRGPEFQNSLGHEVSHLVFEILDRAGMKLCRETLEAYGYLQGYFQQQIYKRL